MIYFGVCFILAAYLGLFSPGQMPIIPQLVLLRTGLFTVTEPELKPEKTIFTNLFLQFYPFGHEGSNEERKVN